MKKIFTLLSLAIALTSIAGTPTLDGVYSPSEGWGAVRGSGTQVGASIGWAGTDAMKLYVTSDASYYYFGAQCKASSWMQFMFVVNTKAGGDSIDPWGRTVKYKYTNLPDYIFRGDISGSNYAQFQGWTGTAWHRWNGTTYQAADVNANASGTEVKGTFNANDSGFIEIRVPKAAITGTPTIADVQFIIGGNSDGDASGHGIFDAIPNETNGTAWGAPGNATVATTYVTSVPLPISLNYFKGNIKNNNIGLEWQTASEANVNGFEVEKQQGNNWNKLGFVAALNNEKGSTYSFNDASINGANIYRIKTISNNGEARFSQTVVINTSTKGGTQLFPTTTKGGSINIRTFENLDGKANIRVIDASGKTVQQTSLNLSAGDITQSYQLNHLKIGLYVVEVATKSGNKSFKVFVQ